MDEAPEVHPAALLMPLDEDNIPGLADDIRANGLADDIELFDGKVIDGRRRLRACQLAGVAPRFKAVSPADPVTYVLSKQNRRDLTPSQRAMIGARATKLRDELAAAAKERHATAVARSNRARADKPSVEPVPPMDTEPAKSRDAIGKLVGVSGRTIDFATKVVERGIPELAQAVDEGRMAVKTAAVLATEPEEVQRAEIADPKRKRKYKAADGGGVPRAEVAPADAVVPPAEFRSKRASREDVYVSPPPVGAVAVGGFWANAAINLLLRIPMDDPQRELAGRLIMDWARNNLKGK